MKASAFALSTVLLVAPLAVPTFAMAQSGVQVGVIGEAVCSGWSSHPLPTSTGRALWPETMSARAVK